MINSKPKRKTFAPTIFAVYGLVRQITNVINNFLASMLNWDLGVFILHLTRGFPSIHESLFIRVYAICNIHSMN